MYSMYCHCECQYVTCRACMSPIVSCQKSYHHLIIIIFDTMSCHMCLAILASNALWKAMMNNNYATYILCRHIMFFIQSAFIERFHCITHCIYIRMYAYLCRTKEPTLRKRVEFQWHNDTALTWKKLDVCIIKNWESATFTLCMPTQACKQILRNTHIQRSKKLSLLELHLSKFIDSSGQLCDQGLSVGVQGTHAFTVCHHNIHCTHTRTHMHECLMHVHTHTHTHSTHAYTHTHTHAHTHTSTHAHKHTHTRMHTCTQTRTHAHTHLSGKGRSAIYSPLMATTSTTYTTICFFLGCTAWERNHLVSQKSSSTNWHTTHCRPSLVATQICTVRIYSMYVTATQQ